MVNEKNEQPNLEQIVGAAKAAEGAAFRYKPINPKDTYDREAFVSALSEFSDLEQYRKALDQDPSNLGAREDLFGLLYGDPSFHRGFSPEDVKKSAKEAYKAGLEQTARYVEHNHNKFFNDLLDDKAMHALLMNVPLYKIGNNEHDTLVSIINDVKSMNAATQAENPIEKMSEFVLKRTKSDAVPGWAKKLIKYFSGDPRFVQRVFMTEFAAKQQVLSAAISRGEGIDQEKVRRILENSLSMAYEKLDDGDNSDDEKKDIWEECIRPYYVTMAKLAYKSEKEKIESDDEDKVKEDKRKAERAAIGMAA
jgi:hypothetical protein